MKTRKLKYKKRNYKYNFKKRNSSKKRNIKKASFKKKIKKFKKSSKQKGGFISIPFFGGSNKNKVLIKALCSQLNDKEFQNNPRSTDGLLKELCPNYNQTAGSKGMINSLINLPLNMISGDSSIVDTVKKIGGFATAPLRNVLSSVTQFGNNDNLSEEQYKKLIDEINKKNNLNQNNSVDNNLNQNNSVDSNLNQNNSTDSNSNQNDLNQNNSNQTNTLQNNSDENNTNIKKNN